MTAARPWLIAVDMQACFAEPGSPWWVPGYVDVEPAVQRLLHAYGARSTVTRFVSPPKPTGSWVGYYRQWPNMLLDADDHAWDLTVEVPSGASQVTRPTFSKWDDEAAAAVPAEAPLLVCGVATEACVLATVSSAVDDGWQVLLVADACRGATNELHEAAVAVLEALRPQVTIVTIDEAVALAARAS